jgi:hypothetical protein
MGKEFAMQHLGAEDEMLQTLEDLLASLPVEERLKGVSPEQLRKVVPPEQLRQALSPEERLKGLTPEERLTGMTPAEFERLKQLVQERAKADDSANPG